MPHGVARSLTCRELIRGLACAAALLPACADADAGFRSRRDAGTSAIEGGRDAARGSEHDDPDASQRDETGTVHVGDGDADGDGCGRLRARVRDFSLEHPDFEGTVNGRVVVGIVEDELGSDGKPVVDESFAAENGVSRFAEWYVDMPGVNEPFDVEIALTASGDGRFVFDSSAFFPLDERGFGNEHQGHNFHFTTEIHTRFMYRAGDSFTFAGDDDLWLFINGRLAIDLGGVHARETQTVELDARAEELGIEVGRSYAMDIFHAERHTGESNFRIETTIACLEPVFVQ